MDVLTRLSQLMEERGWSKYQLAKRAGISPSTLNSLFRKNNAPTIPTLQNLCDALSISLSDFFLEHPSDAELSAEEKELLNYWRNSTPKQKEAIILFYNQHIKAHR